MPLGILCRSHLSESNDAQAFITLSSWGFPSDPASFDGVRATRLSHSLSFNAILWGTEEMVGQKKTRRRKEVQLKKLRAIIGRQQGNAVRSAPGRKRPTLNSNITPLHSSQKCREPTETGGSHHVLLLCQDGRFYSWRSTTAGDNFT